VVMPLAVKLPLPLVEGERSFHPSPLEAVLLLVVEAELLLPVVEAELLLPVVEAELLLLEVGQEVPAMVLL